MLKKRVIACLIIKDGIVVQSVNFKRYLPIGRADIAVEFLNNWGIDEIVILDINATLENREPDYRLIEECSGKCFVPLTVGGGIKNLRQIKKLIQHGADKVCINSSALDCNFVESATNVFGDQCIIVSIDAVIGGNGEYKMYSHIERAVTGDDPFKFAREMEKLGAGEIFLNSVDQDGAKTGYDLKLIKKMVECVNMPVIACGGAGKPDHFLKAVELGSASAVAAGNYFHFTEHSVNIVKSMLKNQGMDVRLNNQADYIAHNIDTFGRVAKAPDKELENLLYKRQMKEVI